MDYWINQGPQDVSGSNGIGSRTRDCAAKATVRDEECFQIRQHVDLVNPNPNPQQD